MAAVFVLLASMSFTKAESKVDLIHNVDNVAHFSSIQEITNYFGKVGVSIKILRLKKFGDERLLFAAYPYSGLDTIDVFYFVKYGEQWVLNMLYFHLGPKDRTLRVEERRKQIFIFCGKEEIFRLTPDQKLNSLAR